MKTKLSLHNIPLYPGRDPVSWNIAEGQNWILRGDLNSGRSEWIRLLTGSSFLFEEKVIHYFCDTPQYGFYTLNPHLVYLDFRGMIADHQQYYYQQRYNASDSDEVVTLRDLLFPEPTADLHEREMLVRLFGLRHCLDEEIIKLSSGEYRKASVVNAILKKPRLLVLDEPYAGLDRTSVTQMDDLLSYISESGTLLVLSSNAAHIPDVITHVLSLQDHTISYCGSVKHFHPEEFSPHSPGNAYVGRLPGNTDAGFDTAFEMKDTTVKYGERVILNNISWKVHRGDKWLLSGRNGAGKSMLLSLVCADNPQAYANNIVLFDRRRGTGETIWEIKERIGYFSSELFIYYDKMKTTTEAAFRYLSANPYHKRKVSENERMCFDELTAYFTIRNYRDKPLHAVPFEVRRIYMLLNVFLGNAPLIILDEPYHGLDEKTIRKMNHLLEQFASSRTLVFVSHDPDRVPAMVSHEYRLSKGKGMVVW